MQAKAWSSGELKEKTIKDVNDAIESGEIEAGGESYWTEGTLTNNTSVYLKPVYYTNTQTLNNSFGIKCDASHFYITFGSTNYIYLTAYGTLSINKLGYLSDRNNSSGSAGQVLGKNSNNDLEWIKPNHYDYRLIIPFVKSDYTNYNYDDNNMTINIQATNNLISTLNTRLKDRLNSKSIPFKIVNYMDLGLESTNLLYQYYLAYDEVYFLSENNGVGILCNLPYFSVTIFTYDTNIVTYNIKCNDSTSYSAFKQVIQAQTSTDVLNITIIYQE